MGTMEAMLVSTKNAKSILCGDGEIISAREARMGSHYAMEAPFGLVDTVGDPCFVRYQHYT